MVLFLNGRVRADLVALLVIVSLGASGILTPEEAFSGFSRSAVIAIMAIFILAESLTNVGLTEWAAQRFQSLAGRRPHRLVLLVMLAGALLSLFMNNIAAAAVLLPGATTAARKSGVHPSRVLMPLAFGTLLGGMATLLTSTNIVASSLLQAEGFKGFGILDFAPLGLPMLAAGIFYMARWGEKLLPVVDEQTPANVAPGGPDDLVDIYRLMDRLFRAKVPAGSYLIGRPVSQSTFREKFNLNLVGLERAGALVPVVSPETVIQERDVLILEGRLEEFQKKDRAPYLEILPRRDWHDSDLETTAITIIEAVLSPRASIIGKTSKGGSLPGEVRHVGAGGVAGPPPDPNRLERPAARIRRHTAADWAKTSSGGADLGARPDHPV